jgi:hypothetical protein
VTHACNSSYLGGWDWENHSSRPGQIVVRSPLQNNRAKQTRGVAQVVERLLWRPEVQTKVLPSPQNKIKSKEESNKTCITPANWCCQEQASEIQTIIVDSHSSDPADQAMDQTTTRLLTRMLWLHFPFWSPLISDATQANKNPTRWQEELKYQIVLSLLRWKTFTWAEGSVVKQYRTEGASQGVEHSKALSSNPSISPHQKIQWASETTCFY